MPYEYLMNTTTALYLVCYVPELYANYKNKNANLYNVPEKIVILIGTGFAFAYAVLTEDQALLINYGPLVILDFIACAMRAYYAYQNHRRTYRKMPDICVGATAPAVEASVPDVEAKV